MTILEPVSAETLGRILATRVFDSAQFFLEWQPDEDQSKEDRYVGQVMSLLEQDYPGIQSDSYKSLPMGLIRRGSDREIRIVPGRLHLTRAFSGAHRHDWNLVSTYCSKHWPALIEGLGEAGLEGTFLALIVNLEYSTLGYGVRPGQILTRFVNLPVVESIVEADVRVARIERERFFLNYNLGGYIVAEQKLAPGLNRVGVAEKKLDEGITVKLDVNTKVDTYFGRELMPVVPTDLLAALEIAGEAAEQHVGVILRGAP